MPRVKGQPYGLRTFLRGKLPWFILNTGILDKGANCENSGGEHEWYNKDNIFSACYHCVQEKKGQLWKS